VVKRCCGALLALVLVAATVSGCRPSSPSQSGWQSSAEQAVSDMISEVATSRLTVEESLRGRFVGRYPAVVLTYSEEASGKAVDSVSALQPPPSARPGYGELTGVLSDASDSIARARIAVTKGDTDDSRAAVRALERASRRLHVLEDQLKAAR
jgi:hypothetical protein